MIINDEQKEIQNQSVAITVVIIITVVVFIAKFSDDPPTVYDKFPDFIRVLSFLDTYEKRTVEDPRFEHHCRTITSCRCELSKWLSSAIITSGKKQMTAHSRYARRDRAKALLRITRIACIRVRVST